MEVESTWEPGGLPVLDPDPERRGRLRAMAEELGACLTAPTKPGVL